jgi:formamidopyrimidine-DNA glycosylase|tara:strand:+ start:332 stop:1201 length:870 start_codon:yes stop_codon:yes gene_type:complete
MPELPEVEVVKRSLTSKIQKLVVEKITVKDEKLRYRINKKKLKILLGLKIIKILRRSKFLLFVFEKNTVMLVHLGMTGKFFFLNKNAKKFKTSFYYNIDESKDNKHNRLIFSLSKKQKLIYNDVRKFGFIKILDKRQLQYNLHLKNLGPEPLGNSFDFKYFKNYLINRNRTIKDILMDQKFVSGLGNIYVNEVLFLSKVKPTKKTYLIKNSEIYKIIKNTKKTLKKAISLGGSSLKDFSSSDGKKGEFQQYFYVYGRKGENCLNRNCNKKIIKTIIGNRATFYCPKCQK